MRIRMESHDGPQVGSSSEVIADFADDTQQRQAEWRQRLTDNPDSLAELEEEVTHHFRWAAGRLIASLLAEATGTAEMQEKVAEVRQRATEPLKSPQQRRLKLRLLCGLMLYITTAYCAPLPKRREETEQSAGLYPELAALGVFKGATPALQYRVARAVAWCPSMDAARKELAREGLKLNKKAVGRIAEQLGQQLLVLRHRELMAWRSGELQRGTQLAGKRVSVQLDGGRVRLRYAKSRKKQKKSRNQAKKSRKTSQKSRNGSDRRKKGKLRKKPPFDTAWREPKVLTIYEYDERGQMKRTESFKLVDGTLESADHLAELVAFHLDRLGASQANQVTFVCDGAAWIWDRLDWISERAGLDASRTYHVLDFYHAAHHVGLALTKAGLKDDERKSEYRRLRQLLKKSRYDKVSDRLQALACHQPPDSDVWTEIDYLRHHGERGRLNYATFRRRGIPCGSGAVESTIRQVINLRLKNNSTYWREENAEAIFAVRALLVTDRWDEVMPRVRETMSRDRRMTWRWKAPPTAKKNLKSESGASPSNTQSIENKQPTELAT